MSKYTDLAKKVPCCMGCRTPNDGTVVLAHRNLNGWGLRAGKGIKTLDILGAFLCRECHAQGDAMRRRDFQFWELAVHRSITWAYDNGYITIEA
jgi:hypothetical protein